jgi:hypothetical protein
MRTFNKHPQWFNVPLRLDKAQRQNPGLAIDDFFECYHLNEVREILWNWMVEVVSSPHGISHDHHERNNHIYFYEKLEMLVEAAWMVRRANRRHLRRMERRKRSR